MKINPVLFKKNMVDAIWTGRKTQTRRIMKQQPFDNSKLRKTKPGFAVFDNIEIPFPFGSVGDLLYVKESYYAYGMWLPNGFKNGRQKFEFLDLTIASQKQYIYHEDFVPGDILKNSARKEGWYLRNSLFMPFAASRIKLEVKYFTCERLNDISESDAIAEGVKKWISVEDAGMSGYDFENYMPGPGYRFLCSATESYKSLWESINGIGSWDRNPWVWVIEFEII